jgi:hypothetical protein
MESGCRAKSGERFENLGRVRLFSVATSQAQIVKWQRKSRRLAKNRVKTKNRKKKARNFWFWAHAQH